MIKNVSVHVSNAVPKVDFNASGYHNNHHNYGSNHHYGSNQSNYHHNSARYSPYNKGGHDMRRNHHHRSNQFNNQANSNSLHANNLHSSNNPLVNSTYNNHPAMVAPISPNPPIWSLSGNRADQLPPGLPGIPGLPPVANTQYGMNNLAAQKHYGQH